MHLCTEVLVNQLITFIFLLLHNVIAQRCCRDTSLPLWEKHNCQSIYRSLTCFHTYKRPQWLRCHREQRGYLLVDVCLPTAGSQLAALLHGDGEDGMRAGGVLVHVGGSCSPLQGASTQHLRHLSLAAHLLLCCTCQADATPRHFPDVHALPCTGIRQEQVPDLFLQPTVSQSGRSYQKNEAFIEL